MKWRRYAILIATICLGVILPIAGWKLSMGRKKPMVTVAEIVQEREKFGASRPLRAELGSKERWSEHAARCRAYAATSTWENKAIIVHGYWNNPYGGFSISTKPPGGDGEFLPINQAGGTADSQMDQMRRERGLDVDLTNELAELGLTELIQPPPPVGKERVNEAGSSRFSSSTG